MKKVIMCMAVACLAMSGFYFGIVGLPSEQEAENIRKNQAKRREHIKGHICRPVAKKDMPELRRSLGLSDDKVMQAELMDIIREASAIAGWAHHNPGGPKEREIDFANAYLRRAVGWLEFCADAEGKKFLMDIITDDTKHSSYRSLAIGSYLCRADAQETQDALIRFFADDMKTIITPFSLFYTVIQAYDVAEDNPEKREVIIAELTKEDNKKAFDEMDKLLAEQNERYAELPQRKAALEPLNKPSEEKTP